MVGRRAQGQSITLYRGHDSIQDIVRDLFHTLGRYHEHQRPDRDDYVTINWENIKPGIYAWNSFNGLCIVLEVLGASTMQQAKTHRGIWR